MGFKETLGEYFSFTRKDRIAILIIIALIIGIFFLPGITAPAKKPATTDTAWITTLQQLERKDSLSIPNRSYTYEEHNTTAYQYDRPTGYRQKGELFYFDPNTLSPEGWAKLGIREKTINTIQNYLSKGGKFRRPEDVERIYGLFPDEFERIAPYIQIANSGDNYQERNYSNNNTPPSYTPKPATNRYAMVDINNADTTAYVALPGIGSKLAGRIVNFRDKLGGFYSVQQVAETFGLPDSTFQRIKQYLQMGGVVKKININTATVDELKAHPYIKWALANPIVAYRKEHGNFSKIEDIKNVMAVTDDAYNKMVPYLTVN